MSDNRLKKFFFGKAYERDSAVNDESADLISYRLALSVVKISGEVTSGFSAQTSLPFKAATSDIQLSVAADPRPKWRRQISVSKAFTKDKEFELELTPDGRLTSSMGTSTGAGSAMIEAGIRIGTFVGAQLVGALAKSPLRFGARADEERRPKEKTFDQTLRNEKPDLYRRRESYRSAITALQDKIAEHGAQVAVNPTASGVLLEGTVLRSALDRVRAEAAAVEAEVDAWRGSRFPTSSKEYTFEVGSDDLPERGAADAAVPFVLSELAPPLREAAEKLGVVVARVREPKGMSKIARRDDDEKRGIHYRMARPTNLAVYERPLDSSGEFTLRTVTPAWLVDSESELGLLTSDSSLFEKNASGLEFGETGTIGKVTVNRESAARQLSTALAAAPGQIKESVEQASAVTEGLTKIKAAGAERRLADLKRRKDIVDAEIAEKGALATRAQREELDRLKVQIDVADAQSKLAPEPVEQPSPNKELETRLERAKLEFELKQAEFGADLLSRFPVSSDGPTKPPTGSPG